MHMWHIMYRPSLYIMYAWSWDRTTIFMSRWDPSAQHNQLLVLHCTRCSESTDANNWSTGQNQLVQAYHLQINPNLSCEFGHFRTFFLFAVEWVALWLPKTQKLKIGKFWNLIFHSHQHIPHLLCKDNHLWGKVGLLILSWETTLKFYMFSVLKKSEKISWQGFTLLIPSTIAGSKYVYKMVLNRFYLLYLVKKER